MLQSAYCGNADKRGKSLEGDLKKVAFDMTLILDVFFSSLLTRLTQQLTLTVLGVLIVNDS